MELQELKILGLTQGEIKVYSALLYKGVSAINNIHEGTGMERRAIYDILNKLIEKGFVAYTIEKGKRTYHVAPIQKIRETIKNKKQEVEKCEKMIPSMEEIYKSSKPKINIEIFRGKEGIKALFEDMLDYKENCFIGGRWYITKEMPVYWKHYDERRIKANVRWFNLVLHDAPQTPTEKLVSVRKLPKEFTGTPAIIWIYGNKVVNVVWGDYFFATMTESKEIAENYKKYFWYLWEKVAKP